MTNIVSFPSERVDYRPRVLTEMRVYEFARPQAEETELPMSVYYTPLTWLMFGAIMWLAVRA